jgi:hypothetical protein
MMEGTCMSQLLGTSPTSTTRRRRLATVSALALAVAPIAVLGISAPAMARCAPYEFYSIPSYSSYQLPAAGTYFKDGPGGTMTASVTTASTISATGSVTAGATISGIVAQAKVEVTASITKSKSVTVGHTYSHDISAGKYGNLQYGSWGYKVNWRFSERTESCTNRLLSSGTAKVPTTAVGWRYWETN